jgi:hypothetical protein
MLMFDSAVAVTVREIFNNFVYEISGFCDPGVSIFNLSCQNSREQLKSSFYFQGALSGVLHGTLRVGIAT